MQPFYCTLPDALGEYDAYFVDHHGAYVTREHIRDLGHAFTLRTDILPTDAFSGRQVQKKSWRSSWPPLMRLRLRRSAYKTRQAASVEPY